MVKTVVSLCSDLGVRGGEVLPIIGLVSLLLQTPWLAPSFTRGSDRLATGEGEEEGGVVVVVWDTVECVCTTLRMTRACKLAANLPMQSWRPGLRSPELNLPRSWDEQDCPPNHADRNASSCNQHLKYQNTQNSATSSKHVDEHA